MKVFCTHLGPRAWASAYAEGLHVSIEGRHFWLEQGLLREAVASPDGTLEQDKLPLARADFGKCERLAWTGGACAIPTDAKLVSWKNRYVAALDAHELVVIDTQRSLVVSIAIEDQLIETNALVQGETLWLCGETTVAIALAQLDALFERQTGPLEIVVDETYPLRKPKRVDQAHIKYIFHDKLVVVREDNSSEWLYLPLMTGVEEGLGIKLLDEIHHGKYCELEFDGKRRVIFDPQPQRTFTAELTVGPAIDPAGDSLSTDIVPSRQADLDRLFCARIADPDDVEILVDLLEESGEPYAALLHAAIAGDESRQGDALGLLASYFEDVTYRRGLPWEATLVTDAPLDPDIGDAAAADQRLGFFHTLWIGEGPFAVYAKLVGSPRAVGLRWVDVPNSKVLAALVSGRRTQLERLSNVKFATRAVIDGIADPTFDSVTHLHTVIEFRTLDKQLAFLERDPAGFFKRKPRHLILTESIGRKLLERVETVWRRLPVESVTVDGQTLTR